MDVMGDETKHIVGLFKQRRGGSIKGRQYRSVVGAFGEIKKDFKKVVKLLTRGSCIWIIGANNLSTGKHRSKRRSLPNHDATIQEGNRGSNS